MKTFVQWAEDRKLELPVIEKPTEQPTLDEKTKREAIRSYAYPPQYGSAQYPPEYFRPIAADAPVYQEKSKK